MSDYCFQCTEKYLGMPGDKNDLSGISTPQDTANDMFASVICEGCGFVFVDHEGRCVSESPDCMDNHGSQN